MAPLRSLNSLRRYVGTADDWRQGVWNRWLVSYLTPREDGESTPREEAEGDDAGSDATVHDVHDASVHGDEARSHEDAVPTRGAEQSPDAPSRVAAERRDSGPVPLSDDGTEPSAVERRQLAARARLEALSEQMFSVEEGLDALGQRLQVREVTDRRSTQRMMELIERVVEAAERQSEALERSIATMERVERRLARLDRWVRPSGVESVPPPPAATSGIVGVNGHGGPHEVRVALGDEAPATAPRVPSMNGSLCDMSVATLLSMFELERRTGWLTIEGERERVRFELLDGTVVRGRIGDRAEDPLEVLRAAIGWRLGTFSFCPVAVVAGSYPARSVGAMLLEASHQNDEAVRIVG